MDIPHVSTSLVLDLWPPGIMRIGHFVQKKICKYAAFIDYREDVPSFNNKTIKKGH